MNAGSTLTTREPLLVVLGGNFCIVSSTQKRILGLSLSFPQMGPLSLDFTEIEAVSLADEGGAGGQTLHGSFYGGSR